MELCALNAYFEEHTRLRASRGGPPAEFFPSGVGFRASTDSLAVVEVEQSLERERLELRLQEFHFRERRDHLKNEVNSLRKSLDQEVKRRQAALEAHAAAKGKLSLLHKQVKGAASLVGETFGEAIHSRGLQLERSRMYQSLEGRASRALSDICGEGFSSTLVPDDGGYLGFFLHVVEHLEAGAEKAHVLAEEKSRDLLGQGASGVFSHLLCLDPDFDFVAVLDPVP
ncbi:hypothetical protein D1007_61173 [Hordeum vulgare]|nr:hypothetical protein D1007_61173 [Hordeum vulgare]